MDIAAGAVRALDGTSGGECSSRHRALVTPTPTPAAGALRPLSDADALELDEDDEGAD